jgi:hypothetical protein
MSAGMGLTSLTGQQAAPGHHPAHACFRRRMGRPIFS